MIPQTALSLASLLLLSLLLSHSLFNQLWLLFHYNKLKITLLLSIMLSAILTLYFTQ